MYVFYIYVYTLVFSKCSTSLVFFFGSSCCSPGSKLTFVPTMHILVPNRSGMSAFLEPDEHQRNICSIIFRYGSNIAKNSHVAYNLNAG